MTINLTINDQNITAKSGQTILEAARENNIEIPTLCYHKDLSPVGSCRLCLVEVEKWRGQVAACTTQAAEGMIIHTETPAVTQSRRLVLEMLLANYADAGYAAQDGRFNELTHWVNHYQVKLPAGAAPKFRYTIDSDPNPFVWVDFNKCILCTRCVRACSEIQSRYVWGVNQRGYDTHIMAGANTDMLDARCESCGACVAYCPTGALDNKMSVGLGAPDRLVTTTCTYCGVGCQFDLNVKDNQVIRVTSNPAAAVNGMHLCVKGRYGYDFIHHPDRLTRPRVRRYLLEGKSKPRLPGEHHQIDFDSPDYEWVEVDWDSALSLSADQLRNTRDTYGSDSIGVLTSAKCTNEENYLMNKFARQVVGTNNIDHCARL